MNYLIKKNQGERVKGIEPSYAAWEAAVLPLNYTRGCEFELPDMPAASIAKALLGH